MMLCCCLRGSLAVLEFSRLGSGFEPFSWLGNLYCRALVEGQLEVGEYLWGCAAVETLTHRFCPRLVSSSRMASSVAWRFLSSVLVSKETGRRHKRDIYREMLEEPHCCPLVEYSLLAPPWRTPTISELSSLIETQGWGALSLPSLLPASEIQHLTGPEINTHLAWSVYRQRAEQLEPPVIVVGVLQLSTGSVCVQLADQTGSLDCVLVETDPNTSHTRAGIHTAWTGCLVQLRSCSVVMERFLRTEFPSWKQLEDSQFIRERSCRVYVQFSVNDVQILSQSSAMSTLQSRESEGVGREREGEGGTATPEPSVKKTDRTPAPEPETDREIPDSSDKTVQDSSQEISPKSPPGKKPAGETGMWNSVRKRKVAALRSWVSVLLRVTQKEGLMFRNAHPSSLVLENRARNRTGLGLGFGATAYLAGEPQVWSRDPRNSPLREEERGGESNSAPLRAELQFVGDSVRWFPLIHPGRLYRLVAPNTADPNVFGQLSSPPAVLPVGAPQGSQCSLFLPVHPDWRLQCLEPHPREESWSQDLQPLLSVSALLSLSPSPTSLLSFSGLILDRVTLDEGKGKAVIVQSQGSKLGVALDCGVSVQLSVCDADRPSQSLKVYIDFTHLPYIPGLLPGARVNFHRLESKLSRQGKLYCRYTALSCLTVVGLGGDDSPSPNLDLDPSSPPPLVDLGDWASDSVHSILGRVRCHVSSVVLVDLQWTCSQCGSVFKQGRCTRNHPPCSSENGVFQAKAKFVVDDGSGFAHVVCRNRDVSVLLRLGGAEWEELQREVGVRGHVTYDCRGKSDEDGAWEQSEDSFLLSLSTLCCSVLVCSPVQITCRLSPGSLTLQQRLEKAQLKRFTIDDFEFLTWVPPHLQLNCEEMTRQH